jgi:phosphatidate cytidylyltransferase
LRTRIITGFLFGIILIGGILLSEYSFVALLLGVLLIGQYELLKLLATTAISAKPNKFLSYLLSLTVFGGFIFFPVLDSALGISSIHYYIYFSIIILLITAIMVVELFSASNKAAENIVFSLFGSVYLSIPLGFLVLIAMFPDNGFHPWTVLFFFFFMWSSDTGAYFTGRFFGKTKLLERLSPKKTVEGFIGGMIVSALMGVAAWYVLGMIPLWTWVSLGALMAFTGTAGDLFESMLKRQSGIKDSGNLLPGHGGILDRFDSTFLSAPLFWMLLKLSEFI